MAPAGIPARLGKRPALTQQQAPLGILLEVQQQAPGIGTHLSTGQDALVQPGGQQTKRFQLTPRVMEIGYNYLPADTLVDVANPFLAELAQVTGETTNLTGPDGLDMVYVARFVAPEFIPIHMSIGSRIPLYCTGSGRAYLSALPAADAGQILEDSERQAHTRHTLTELTDILREIEASQQRGYALNAEELFLGDMSIAAPILGSQGLPVAAVHGVVPSSRWTLEEAERKLAPAVIECARAIRASIRTL